MSLGPIFYRFGDNHGVGRVRGSTVIASVHEGSLQYEDVSCLSSEQITAKLAANGCYLGTACIVDEAFQELDADAPFDLGWHKRTHTWSLRTWKFDMPDAMATFWEDMANDLANYVSEVALFEPRTDTPNFRVLALQATDPVSTEEVLMTLDCAKEGSLCAKVIGYGQASSLAVFVLGWLAKRRFKETTYTHRQDNIPLTGARFDRDAMRFIGFDLNDSRLMDLATQHGLIPDFRIKAPNARLPSIAF